MMLPVILRYGQFRASIEIPELRPEITLVKPIGRSGIPMHQKHEAEVVPEKQCLVFGLISKYVGLPIYDFIEEA